ncbi:hypothetical protein LJC12_03090 [Odoribacter sp. OttesenSCG-928-J03]|nr:hypothetical protein [Odoribacter sp. OttesenSCG-928-J03]
MEEKEKIERIELFLAELKDELGKLQDAGLNYMHFVIMGQTIEVLGGFLDTKPLKAKDQSAKRFSAAINYLFGGQYRIRNEKRALYDKLRNQMTHSFIPGKGVKLLNRANNNTGGSHLDIVNGSLILISEDFFDDIIKASNRLSDLLKSGKIKPKTIAFGDDE